MHFYGRWAADEQTPAKLKFLSRIGSSSDAGGDAVKAYHSTTGLRIVGECVYECSGLRGSQEGHRQVDRLAAESHRRTEKGDE